MNWQNLYWEMYAVAIVAIGLINLIMKNFKKDIEKRFIKIDFDLKDIRGDLEEIKERLTYLEVANIFNNMPIEPAQPNLRSLKAKEMWVRRKQKKVDNKEGT